MAQKIAADKVDVLINLGGHTRGSDPVTLVMARRPSPVQLMHEGYAGTMVRDKWREVVGNEGRRPQAGGGQEEWREVGREKDKTRRKRGEREARVMGS